MTKPALDYATALAEAVGGVMSMANDMRVK